MKPESAVVLEELKKHVRKVVATLSLDIAATADLFPAGCLISYGVLCERIGAPFLTQSAGHFLYEVAGACAEKDWPPLHALVVNAQTKMPGPRFAGAPGSSFESWIADIKRCLEYRFDPENL